MLTDSRAITDADVAAETAWCERLIALTERGLSTAVAVAVIAEVDAWISATWGPLLAAVGIEA